jgi:hypothetical protein
MAARTRAATETPRLSDFVSDDARVVAVDSFRPRGAQTIVRGRFYRLSDPAVKTWPAMFALAIPIDQLPDELLHA